MIIFGPLPPTGHSKHKGPGAEYIADQLRSRPGEWAHIRTYDGRSPAESAAYMIRKARTKAWAPVGSFEATSRTVNGEFRVYARYVGESA